MGKKARVFVVAALAIFALADLAQAQQLGIGPVSAVTGFPRFFRDSTIRTNLGLCLDGPAFCAPDPVRPGKPQSVATGFGLFANYFHLFVRDQPVTPTNVVMRIEFFVQATYSGLIPRNIADGNQIVLNRMFLTFRNMPAAGTYIVRHPWGQTKVTVNAQGRARKAVQSVGRPTDVPPFSNAQNGPVKTFVTARVLPPGHIGRFSVDQRITGSPLNPPRDFIEVVGPVGVDIGGPDTTPNIRQITRFTIEGKIF